MSGHSKWATIHRQKEVKDAKKGVAFTKLAQIVTLSVKQGGGIGDPDKNFKLRLAVDRARAANMPKENIARAIEKGMGAGEGANMQEAMFEGFAPGGVAVLVEAITDNKLRTAQQVREVFDRGGGSMGSVGAVSYLFNQVGELRIKNNELNLGDEDELKIIDLGVNDIEMDSGEWTIYCEKSQTYEIKDKAEKMGYQVLSAELVMKPINFVEVKDAETAQKVEAILEKLEDLDDVLKVWSNYA